MNAVLRGKFIALNASIKKLESCHNSNLKAHLNALEKKKKRSKQHTKEEYKATSCTCVIGE
jgi:hypothetical protein